VSRRIFISHQHDDQNKAKGFNLLRWNKNVDLTFVGRHLLDPVNSENRSYITGKIKEQLSGSSVTVVLVGKNTHQSEWVRDEIKWSLEKEKPNGILAIRLYDDVELPTGSPVGDALREVGAEIINWDPHSFGDAIERAAAAAGRVQAMNAAATRASSSLSSCSR
jgi:hypothetical protein